MAQPAGAKLRIRLKGLGKGAPNHSLARSSSTQLLALRSAVEAFCRQGVNSLPGAVLLDPWREDVPEQQWLDAAPAAGQGQQLAPAVTRRVRKPRAGAVLDAGVQLPQWGQHRRRRSALSARRRGSSQLLGSLSVLLGEGLQLQPASTSAPVGAEAAAAGAMQEQQHAQPQPKQQSQEQQQQQQPAAAPCAPASHKQPTPGKQPQVLQTHLAAPQSASAQAVQQQGEQAKQPEQVADEQQAEHGQPSRLGSEQQQQQQPAADGSRAADAVSSRLRARKASTGVQQQQEQPAPQQQSGKKKKQQPSVEQQAEQPTKQRRLNNSTKAASGSAATGPAGAGASTVSSAGKSGAGKARAAASAAKPGAAAVAASKAQAAGKAAAPRGAAGGATAAAQQEQPPPAAAAGAPLVAGAAGTGDVKQAAAPAAAKPESPPSETSHQQPIGAAVPQLVQRLHAPQLPHEQTAVSRDRSQCSLPQQSQQPTSQQQPAAAPQAAGLGDAAAAAAAAAGAGSSAHGGSSSAVQPAAASLGTPPASAGAAGAGAGAGAPPGPKEHLLELAPAAMTPAAQALGSMRLPAVAFRRVLPADRPIRTQEQALELLEGLVAAAREKKHLGDRRMKAQGGWDVMALNYYALSALEFLMLNDAGHKLLRQLQERRMPVAKLQDKLAGMDRASSMYKQVGGLCQAALGYSSNCKGPDVAKQALRMLLERMGAICQLKHVHSQREALAAQARLLKGAGSAAAGGGGGSSSRQAAQQPQAAAVALQQQQQQRAAAPSGRPPSRPALSATACANGSSPAAGQQQQQSFNKRSPDDSNASHQDRVQLPGLGGSQDHVSPGRAQGGGGGPGGGGAGGHASAAHHARALMLAESHCAEHLGDLLKITDGMHQTVMRMQQFLETPEVLASEDARAAALHIGVLGLDAGMYSIPRIVAHAEAALTSILKYMRAAS